MRDPASRSASRFRFRPLPDPAGCRGWRSHPIGAASPESPRHPRWRSGRTMSFPVRGPRTGLPELAEAVAGTRYGEDGTEQATSPAVLPAIRERLERASDRDPWVGWAHGSLRIEGSGPRHGRTERRAGSWLTSHPERRGERPSFWRFSCSRRTRRPWPVSPEPPSRRSATPRMPPSPDSSSAGRWNLKPDPPRCGPGAISLSSLSAVSPQEGRAGDLSVLFPAGAGVAVLRDIARSAVLPGYERSGEGSSPCSRPHPAPDRGSRRRGQTVPTPVRETGTHVTVTRDSRSSGRRLSDSSSGISLPL